MNRNTFTKREIQIMKSNPYTYRVTESQIFYTKEFWCRYQEGETTRKIVEELGKKKSSDEESSSDDKCS